MGPLGGPKTYMGRLPVPAHEHMFITEELFELRNTLLLESLQEAKTPPEVIEAWMKIDNAFKKKRQRILCFFLRLTNAFRQSAIFKFHRPKPPFSAIEK